MAFQWPAVLKFRKKKRSMAIQNLRENWTLLVKNLEFWLVVFRHPSEKWCSSSVGSILPNIWKVIKNVWNHQPAGVWWVFFKKLDNPTCYKPATPPWPRHPTPVPEWWTPRLYGSSSLRAWAKKSWPHWLIYALNMYQQYGNNMVDTMVS